MRQAGSGSSVPGRPKRDKRFIDGIASTILYKRFGFFPHSFNKIPRRQNGQKQIANLELGNVQGQRFKSRHKTSSGSAKPHQGHLDQPDSILNPYLDYSPDITKGQMRESLKADLPLVSAALKDNKNKFKFFSPGTETISPGSKSPSSGTFWTFHKVNPFYNIPNQASIPQSYIYGRILHPYFDNSNTDFNDLSADFEETSSNENKKTELDSDSNGRISKRLDKENLLALKMLWKDAYIDEIAAQFFHNSNVFKDKRLNEKVSAYFHKRYVDFMARSFPQTNNQRDGTSTKFSPISNALKRFDIKPLSNTKDELYLRRLLTNLKNYFGFIRTHSLPQEGMASVRAPRQFSEESNKGQSRLSPTIDSRIRSFRSRFGWFLCSSLSSVDSVVFSPEKRRSHFCADQ